MSLDHFLDGFDLRMFHWWISFAGAALSVYSMQMWSSGMIGVIDTCLTVWGMRRASLAALAACFLWSMSYTHSHIGWQPWPPECAMILSIDIYLLATILGGYLRRHQERRDSSVPG